MPVPSNGEHARMIGLEAFKAHRKAKLPNGAAKKGGYGHRLSLSVLIKTGCNDLQQGVFLVAKMK